MSNSKNRELFEDMPVAKAVRTMAIPSIIGQIIVLIYNMADTFFIGRTNAPFMVAGASLILPIFNMCIPLAALSGVGGSALISSLLGEGRNDEARRVCPVSRGDALGRVQHSHAVYSQSLYRHVRHRLVSARR